MEASFVALAKIAGADKEAITTKYHADTFFRQYEKGLISDSSFRERFRKFTNESIEDDEIDRAWNAMLVDLPINRINLVTKLRRDYRVMVLSNTNSIHVKRFNQMLYDVSGKNELSSFFDEVYFSHEINMRKPDAEIYEFVLAENNLRPEETLFLDDNKQNLEAAEQLGIKTSHVDHPDRLFDIFKEWI